MPIPGITINIQTPQEAALPEIDDVVGIIGPVGTGGSATAGNLVSGNTLATFAAVVGTDGFVLEALTQLFANVTVDVVYSPTVASPSTTQVATAIDLLDNYEDTVTLLLLPGNLGGTGATANVNVAKAQSWAANPERVGRAIVNAPRAGATVALRRAAAVTWAAANTPDRVMAVFGGEGAGEYVQGAWLGAALRIAADNGRQWGVQLGRVRGLGALQDTMSLASADLALLDGANISSVVTINGVHRIAGGSFDYASADDPQRDWSVARVVDHAQRIVRQRWEQGGMIGSTASSSSLAAELEAALSPLIINGELTSASVTPVSAVGANRTFDIPLGVQTPAGSLTVNLRLTLA